MKARSIFLLVTTSMTVLFSPGIAQAQAQAAGDTSGASSQSGTVAAQGAENASAGEIVVTASKREQRLRDVPSAISSVSAKALETQGIQSFRDYATLVPGLNQRDLGAPGVGTVIMRGLNTGGQQSTATTASYLDDTPITSSSFIGAGGLAKLEPELADVARIEILKGPQGTLYGASSLGGLVRIISMPPDTRSLSGSFRADATTVTDGNEGYSVRASVNVPLISDTLAIRATGYYRRYPGFVDNVTTGHKDTNDGDGVGGRIALRWTPATDLTLDLSGVYQDININSLTYQTNVTDSNQPAYGNRKYASYNDPASKVSYRILSGAVNYDLGPVSLITTASYVNSKLAVNIDFTPLFAPVLPLYGFPAGSVLLGPVSNDLKKFTAETRLVSKRLGNVEFIVGAFYTHEKNFHMSNLIGINGATEASLPTPYNFGFNTTTDSIYREYALYGNLTYYLHDNLDVTGGIRYANNKETGTLFNNGLFFSPPLPPGGQTLNVSFSDSKLTYLATLRWRPTSRISLFARAASGYRPGGPQNNPNPPPGIPVSVKPDTVWNYEAGVKADLLNNTLSVSASAYHVDWKDIQLNSQLSGLTTFANGGDAKIDGAELELVARPSSALTVSTNLAYTNARISRVDPGVQAAIGAATGDKLPLTADWTAAVLVDQIIPLADDVEGSIGGTLRFESAKPSNYPGDLLSPNVKIPEITTLDLRAGVNFGKKYNVQIRAENIFDRNGYSTLSTQKLFPGQPGPTTATLIRPRSFTISLSVNF